MIGSARTPFLWVLGNSTAGLDDNNIQSLNYERFLLKTINVGLSLRAGCGYRWIDNPKLLSNAFMLNYIVGSSPHYLEIGAGMNIISDLRYPIFHQPGRTGSFHEEMVTGTVGYRYVEPSSGLFMKAGWTPSFRYQTFFSQFGTYIFLFKMGLAIGYTF